MIDPERILIGDKVSIYRRGKRGLWCADFWHEGRHCRQSLKTANQKVAAQRALQLAADLAAGAYRRPPEPITVQAAADAYVSYLETEGRAPKTLVKYRGILAIFVAFLIGLRFSRLQQVNISHFDRFRTERRQDGRHVKTLYTEGVVIKQFFKWAKSRKMLTENPLAEVKLNKPKLEPRGGPSIDQVERILSELDVPLQTPVAILAFTGMRSGEAQRLTPADVDPAANWIHICSRAGLETKTRESRKVPIHARLRPFLEALSRRSRKWLLTAPAGNGQSDGCMSMKRLNEEFLAVVRRLGFPAGRAAGGFTLHSLRHFFETHCVNARIPQRVIDTWLGHRSDKSMAANYYRLEDEESQQFMREVPFGSISSSANSIQEAK